MTDTPDGLTDADRAWMAEQLRLAGQPGPIHRVYLTCGHQMGGPYDTDPRDCTTCQQWLAEHPEAHLATPAQQPPARRRDHPSPAKITLAAVAAFAVVIAVVPITVVVAPWIASTFGIPRVITYMPLFFLFFYFANRRRR